MKKAILRVLMLVFGLNFFTACYGMPPGKLPEPIPVPEEEDEQTKSAEKPYEDSTPEESDSTSVSAFSF